jgi:DNA-binding CsgD family transcriptional regulator
MQGDPNLEFHKANILKVIEADLKSYLAKDKDGWEQNWAHDPRMTSIMECGTLQVARGYEQFRENVFAAMDAVPSPSTPIVERENLRIEVDGTLAWAVFDQIVGNTSDPAAPPNFSHNFRLLEYTNQRWRIVFHGVWSLPERNGSDATVEVDADGRVLWMNAEAMATLKSSSGLTVSAGKLRAQRPKWDKSLRAAYTRASELRNYGVFNAARSSGQQHVRFPVVLGEDKDERLLLCFVWVESGRIYVSFGKNAMLSDQIELAATIYGLTEAQVRLAGLITEGSDLEEAAASMNISINTVKTHLRRMFDKTEARSQLELLRLFLSLK